MTVGVSGLNLSEFVPVRNRDARSVRHYRDGFDFQDKARVGREADDPYCGARWALLRTQ